VAKEEITEFAPLVPCPADVAPAPPEPIVIENTAPLLIVKLVAI
jgi:hypothetical protein